VDSRRGAATLGQDRGMLRLDPSHPPVWRTDSVLQFGAEPVAVLPDPEPWMLRLVSELERGIPDSAFTPLAQAMGAPDAAAASRLLAQLRGSLAKDPPPRPRITVRCEDHVPDGQRDAIAAGVAASGADVAVAHRFDAVTDSPPGSAVLLVVHRVVPPGSAAALMAADRVHVPVALTGTGAEIGPFVVPGRTACLACVAAARRDEDPSWPVVAAQLLGRPVEVAPAVLWEAGIVAGRLIAERAQSPAPPRTRSVALRGDSLHRTVRSHRPHADCRCRSLGESATAAAPALLETRSATAFARPA
jgi:hypothetical protein